MLIYLLSVIAALITTADGLISLYKNRKLIGNAASYLFNSKLFQWVTIGILFFSISVVIYAFASITKTYSFNLYILLMALTLCTGYTLNAGWLIFRVGKRRGISGGKI